MAVNAFISDINHICLVIVQCKLLAGHEPRGFMQIDASNM